MKTIHNLLPIMFLTGLLMINTQTIVLADKPDSTGLAPRSFEVGMFMGPKWDINLMLAIRRPERVTVTLRGTNNAVLHREYLKKTPTSYRFKFNFEEADPGVYQFEVSDGQHTIVRRVEIVSMPAVESQRYITYSPQLEL
jgi:hypothetical protein